MSIRFNSAVVFPAALTIALLAGLASPRLAHAQTACADCVATGGAISLPAATATVTATFLQPQTQTSLAAVPGNGQPNNGFFQTTFSPANGATSFPSGAYSVNTTATYVGWCADSEYTPIPTSEQVTLYSTFGNPPTTSPANIQANANWGKVNYILNNKQGTVGDVQNAIWWVLLPGQEGSGNDSVTDVSQLSAAAQTMVSGADANPNYVPGPGGTVAVLLYNDPLFTFTDNALTQDTIVELQLCGAIGDFVWNDVNDNGIQDAGEPGINGVTVQLLQGGTSIATTVTGPAPNGYPFSPPGISVSWPGGSGYYQFSGLCKGTYTVAIDTSQTALSGFVASPVNNTPNPAIDSNLNPSNVALAADTSVDDTIDFGFYSASTTQESATCAVIAAIQGVPITPVTMVGTGGAGGPYTFTATGLPNGLSISSTGTISGTPTVSGTFSYTVTITDSAKNKGTVSCSVTVAPPVTSTCVVINAIQNAPITPVTLLGSGGAGPQYTFTATGLPVGLSISSTGAISGTPTVSGTFAYTVTITDSAGNTGTLNCSVTVAPPPSATCALINATQGMAISPVTLQGSGGAGARYTFTATGLPAGVSVSSAGVISGTPTVSGIFPYTVTIADRAGHTGTLNCSITVNPPPALTLACPGASGQAGVPYSSSVVASGGVPPYTFLLAAGALPTGLSLNASTGAITGTPTAAGSFAFTIEVKDSVGATAFSTCGQSCSAGVVNTWNFSSIPGPLGTSQTYTVNGIAIVAHGYATNGSPATLSSRIVSGDEFGLGIAGTSQNEIDTTHFVQLDLSAVIASGATNAQIVVNSVACGQSYSIYGSNTLGVIGKLLAGNLTGNNVAIAIPSFPNYKYVSAIASSGNVLLASVSFTLGSCKIVIASVIDLQCGSCGSGNATVGTPYSSTLQVVNGTAPYTFSIVSGSLPPGLTLNSSTGVISGTPTTASTGAGYSFTSKVVDGKGNIDTQTCIIKVVAPVIDLQCGSCETTGKATVGTAYSATYVVVNGKSSYKFTLISGSLPPGLTLNTTTGVISGTPITAGTYTFTATVVDGNNNTDTQQCTITVIAAPLDLECGTCGVNGVTTVGAAYSTAFSVTGGVGPFTYSIASGSLPPGLILNTSTGAITGKPTTAGAYSFVGKVVDSKGNSDTSNCSIKVTGSAMSLSCGSCSNTSNATVGATYNATLTASGGAAPYTYSISSGSLPPGLTLNSVTGAISGKPTTANTYTFTTKAVDKNGKSDTTSCTIKVVGSPVNLYCGSCGSGKATVGAGYSSPLSANGGTSPYAYSIVSGSLPPGLTLNPSNGLISGTPTAPGAYTFTSKVSDHNGNTDTATCTIDVIGSAIDIECGACGSNGNANATLGSPYTENLKVSGGAGGLTFSISSGSLPPGLTLNTSTGAISGTPTKAGTYGFTSKVVDKNGNSDTAVCTIKVTAPVIDIECGGCGSSRATARQYYSDTLQATGSVGSLTFAIANGSLPAGLSLNSSTGTISGTPKQSGYYVFTSKVTDSTGAWDTVTCTLTVYDSCQ